MGMREKGRGRPEMRIVGLSRASVGMRDQEDDGAR